MERWARARKTANCQAKEEMVEEEMVEEED